MDRQGVRDGLETEGGADLHRSLLRDPLRRDVELAPESAIAPRQHVELRRHRRDRRVAAGELDRGPARSRRARQRRSSESGAAADHGRVERERRQAQDPVRFTLRVVGDVRVGLVCPYRRCVRDDAWAGRAHAEHDITGKSAGTNGALHAAGERLRRLCAIGDAAVPPRVLGRTCQRVGDHDPGDPVWRVVPDGRAKIQRSAGFLRVRNVGVELIAMGVDPEEQIHGGRQQKRPGLPVVEAIADDVPVAIGAVGRLQHPARAGRQQGIEVFYRSVPPPYCVTGPAGRLRLAHNHSRRIDAVGIGKATTEARQRLHGAAGVDEGPRGCVVGGEPVACHLVVVVDGGGHARTRWRPEILGDAVNVQEGM